MDSKNSTRVADTHLPLPRLKEIEVGERYVRVLGASGFTRINSRSSHLAHEATRRAGFAHFPIFSRSTLLTKTNKRVKISLKICLK
jgi:hypothetical protein